MKFFQTRNENKWWLTEEDRAFNDEYARGIRNRAAIVSLVGLILILIGVLLSK